MNFTKYHGAGNDFIVIDARTLDLDWPGLARAMCVRHFGVGADGIILVAEGTPQPRMRMFNPDGSEAEACGNGLRCFAKHVVDTGLVNTDSFIVHTLGGPRQAIAFRSPEGTVDEVELSMGAPRFAPEDVPAVVPGHSVPLVNIPVQVPGHTLCVNLVSIGNPHAVMFLDTEPDTYPLGTVGPLLEHHEMFPSRANFEIAQVRTRADIVARVWERGAGETLACGTGACAIAVACIMHELCDNTVHVHLPGGELTITWHGGQEEVKLRGPAVRVFTGNWPD
ncbi:MAG: diaminopimelate epimerase [Chloroflexota bacterium]